MRAYAAAAGRLLDVADSHLGHLKWHNKRLVALDTPVETDLLAAQRSLADTERRCSETGRTAFDGRDHTVEFIRSAMLELEKAMRRRDGT